MCLLEHKVWKGCPPGVAAKGKREGDGKEEGSRGEGRERTIGKNRYNLPSANNRGSIARSIHLQPGLARISQTCLCFHITCPLNSRCNGILSCNGLLLLTFI